jgi:holliday junction DNA helicase RuvA
VIRLIEGTLRHRGIDEVIVSCAGVGYRLRVPAPVLAKLGAQGEQVTLWVHTHVREDAMALYGFSSADQLKLFEVLIGLSGVGAKLGLAILSTLAPRQLATAVSMGDVATLTAVPGIGKRTAERLLVDLRDRLGGVIGTSSPAGSAGAISDAAQRMAADLASGLANLGFKSKAVGKVVADLVGDGSGDLSELFQEAIARLAKTGKTG